MFNQYSRRSLSTVNRQMEALGDSAANINNYFVTGYKARQTRFYDTMNGVKMRQTHNFNTGTPRKTDRELDFAIDGIGFFEVQLPDGSYGYTRNGSFRLGPDGELLSSQGYPITNTQEVSEEAIAESYEDLLSGDSALNLGLSSNTIKVPTGVSIRLDDKGEVYSSDGEDLGKLNVVTFPNVDGLVDVGGGLYLPSSETGAPEAVTLGYMHGETKIKQGHVEASNTSIVENMARIVELNSAIKSQMKVMKVLDQMQESLNSTITRNI